MDTLYAIDKKYKEIIAKKLGSFDDGRIVAFSAVGPKIQEPRFVWFSNQSDELAEVLMEILGSGNTLGEIFQHSSMLDKDMSTKTSFQMTIKNFHKFSFARSHEGRDLIFKVPFNKLIASEYLEDNYVKDNIEKLVEDLAEKRRTLATTIDAESLVAIRKFALEIGYGHHPNGAFDFLDSALRGLQSLAIFSKKANGLHKFSFHRIGTHPRMYYYYIGILNAFKNDKVVSKARKIRSDIYKWTTARNEINDVEIRANARNTIDKINSSYKLGLSRLHMDGLASIMKNCLALKDQLKHEGIKGKASFLLMRRPLIGTDWKRIASPRSQTWSKGTENELIESIKKSVLLVSQKNLYVWLDPLDYYIPTKNVENAPNPVKGILEYIGKTTRSNQALIRQLNIREGSDPIFIISITEEGNITLTNERGELARASLEKVRNGKAVYGWKAWVPLSFGTIKEVLDNYLLKVYNFNGKDWGDLPEILEEIAEEPGKGATLIIGQSKLLMNKDDHQADLSPLAKEDNFFDWNTPKKLTEIEPCVLKAQLEADGASLVNIYDFLFKAPLRIYPLLKRNGDPFRVVCSLMNNDQTYQTVKGNIPVGFKIIPDQKFKNKLKSLHAYMTKKGTRHQSAWGLSLASPLTLVMVISSDGPITVFQAGLCVCSNDPDLKDIQLKEFPITKNGGQT